MVEFINAEIKRCKNDFDYWYKTYTEIIRKKNKGMTLRDFLKELGVDVYEDTQGTLDCRILIEGEETIFQTQHVKIDYTNEEIIIELVNLS